MPKAYEKMRDKFKSGGMGDAAAKRKAARIYNSVNKGKAVKKKGG